MKTKLLSTLLLLLPLWSFGQSSVFKVSTTKGTFYLGGTCHLLRPSDYPLPEEFSEAYQLSDVLILETDVEKMNDPALQQKVLAMAQLEGKSIPDVLPKDIYNELDKASQKLGLPLVAMQNYKPSFIAYTISIMEMQKQGFTTEGVDIFFAKKASADGKTTIGLETVDQQIELLLGATGEEEIAMVQFTISELGRVGEIANELVSAWKNGDLKAIDSLFSEEMREQFPQSYKALIVDRNLAWLKKLKTYDTSEEVEFVLVGAGHLSGDEGLISLLRKEGYTVEQL